MSSKRRSKKKSPAKAVIGAALEIAREHAALIEAAKRTTTEDDRAPVESKSAGQQ